MDERKIEATYKLAKENNEMLRKMRRSQKIARVFRVIYWIVIIGIAVGAYVYIEPYIRGLVGTYNSALDTFDAIR